MPLSLEWILHKNSILAFWAGGKQGDRTTHQFLDPANILNRLRGQIGPGAGMSGRFLPTFDCLIDRRHPRLRAFTGRQVVDVLAAQPVAGADLDRIESVKNIELGQGQTVDAAGPHRLAHQRGIEPSAAALAPGVDAEFLATAADLLADLVVQFGWKRAL